MKLLRRVYCPEALTDFSLLKHEQQNLDWWSCYIVEFVGSELKKKVATKNNHVVSFQMVGLYENLKSISNYGITATYTMGFVDKLKAIKGDLFHPFPTLLHPITQSDSSCFPVSACFFNGYHYYYYIWA